MDRLAAALQSDWANASSDAGGASGTVTLHRAVYGEQGRQLLDAAAAGTPWRAQTAMISSWAELLNLPSVSAWLDQNPGVAWLTQEVPASRIFAVWRVEPALRHPDTYALGEYMVIGQEVDSGETTVDGG